MCHSTLTPAKTPRLGMCHSTLTPAKTPWLGLCHSTPDTCKNTKAWAVSQHTDTCKNTKAWDVSQHTDTCKNTKAWAVSQHTDTCKNTKATLKYSMHYTVMSGLSLAMTSSLHHSIHPPEMDINPLQMAPGCPCGRVNKKMATHTILSANAMHLLVYIYIYIPEPLPPPSPTPPASVQVVMQTTRATTIKSFKIYWPKCSQSSFSRPQIPEWEPAGKICNSKLQWKSTFSFKQMVFTQFWEISSLLLKEELTVIEKIIVFLIFKTKHIKVGEKKMDKKGN